MLTIPDPFPAPDTWYEHRVSYGETDAMAVVFYAEYLHLFERSRGQFIRERGMSYADVEAKGVLLPVVEAGCKYKAPARYDDLIYIRAGISEWRRASMTFVYQVYDESKEKVLTTGFTQHACVSDKRRPVRVPAWLKELFT